VTKKTMHRKLRDVARAEVDRRLPPPPNFAPKPAVLFVAEALHEARQLQDLRALGVKL
jgi:hypothetical protein